MKKNTNKNAIAIIGFDCMVNQPKNLKALISKWQDADLTLPVELARVSKDGRLVPVLDSRNGSDIKVQFAVLKTNKIERAIVEVAKRQGLTNNEKVGFIVLDKCLVNGDCLNRNPESCRKIANWARANGFNAVVWNGLGVKFKDAINVPFSYDNAINYLKSLPKAKKSKAIKYIKSLPKFVNTNLRKIVTKNL